MSYWTGEVSVTIEHTFYWTVDETWEAEDADAALQECNLALRNSLEQAYEAQTMKETWRTVPDNAHVS